MEQYYNNSAPDIIDILTTDVQDIRNEINQMRINMTQTQAGLNQLYQIQMQMRSDIINIRNMIHRHELKINRIDNNSVLTVYKSKPQVITEYVLSKYVVPSIQFIVARLRYLHFSNIKKLIYNKQD